MIYIRQNTPFVLSWEIELQGTAITLADAEISVIASCARGNLDLTDYIYSIEDNTMVIRHNKGLAFVGDYSVKAIIKNDSLARIEVQERNVLRAVAKNDPTETESIVELHSSIVASGGYDSALSEVSQNAIQNAPVAKEFAQVREEIAEASRQAIDEVLGGASEAYDTLLEIEKYIEKDEAGAAALAQSIARLETEKVSKSDIDSALSTESENPVMNKVITEELNKKAEKSDHDALAQSVENNKTATDEAINVLQEELNKKATNEALGALGDSVASLAESKADTDGVYSDLIAGDLAGRGESVPASFGFRASGGKSIKDGRAYIKRIKGNSVVWNQLLLQTNNYVEAGVTSSWNDNICTLSGESSQTYINITSKRIPCSLNEKWALIAEQISNPNDVLFKIGLFNSSNGRAILGNGVTSSAIIINSDYASKGSGFGVDYFGGVGTDLTGIQFKVKIISLTKMFGAGNEPSTIEEFNARKPIVEDEYAYNAGEVIHCNTESIKSVGDNAWDEQWENGTFNTTTGENIDVAYAMKQIRSKNRIKVLPNEQYYMSFPNNEGAWIIFYDLDGKVIENPAHSAGINGNSISLSVGYEQFVTPANADTMRFYMNADYGSTYKHDIMISLVHSGWKQDTDARYQPYWQDTLPLPIIRKYFPDGMKSAGSAHDEIRFNKTTKKWEKVQRIGEVDLGDLDWGYYPAADGYPFGFFYGSPQGRKYGDKNILCGKYAFGHFVNDKSILGNSSGENIYIMDSSYTDAATFKAAMAGVILYYEAAEWEWVELDAEDQNFRDYYNVADFGTEQSQSNVPSAAFSADIIYQFNAVDMIREHEIEITELQKVIATMQAQLTALTNGGQ